MHGLPTRPLLAAAALLGGLLAGCQNLPEDELTTSELRSNCLARFAGPDKQASQDELRGLMDAKQLEAVECESHGEQLDAIQIVEGFMDHDAPPAAGLVFEEAGR